MRQIAITGIRPTPGGIHLGHYVGNLSPAIDRLQNQEILTFFMVANLHSLTGSNSSYIQKSDYILDLLADVIACGISPERVFFYVQNQITVNLLPLFVILSSLTNIPRIQRLPALKPMLSKSPSEVSMATFNFPLLEVVDLLALRANFVYSNVDNKPFIELSNEIAAKFNKRFGFIFPKIELVGGKVPSLVGIDGIKMSKSRGNCIFIRDDTETLNRKIMKMFTDPKRIHENIPGNTENNPIFEYHRVFNPNKEEIKEMEVLYRKGAIKDIEVKQRLFNVMESFLAPIREKSMHIRLDEHMLWDIIYQGTCQAEEHIANSMRLVSASQNFHKFSNDL